MGQVIGMRLRDMRNLPRRSTAPAALYDEGGEWARPPKLRAVAELGPRPLRQRDAERLRTLALVFVLGMACGVMAVDGVLRWFVY